MSKEMTICAEGPEMGINILPDELMIHLFKFLPLTSLITCESVCLRWKKIAGDPVLWRKITIVYSGKPGQSEVSEKNLEIILTHRNLIRNLRVQYVYSYSVIKDVIEECCNLISLELVMCRISKEFEEHILKWPKLRKISLKNSIVLDTGTEISIDFSKFQDLSYLALSDFGLSPVNCYGLLQCNNLCHIYIEKIKTLELSYIKDLIISKQHIVVTLHIYGGSSVDDSCLQLLAKCTNLKDLAIIRSENLTDDGLVALESLKNVEHLQIWNNNNFTEKKLLRTLSNPNIVTLKSLSLSRIQNITPVIVDVISEYYKRLKFLALYQCVRIINTDYEKQLKSKFRNIEVVLY
ncbi:F-box/LRR-repeat protein 7-like [Aricia agestis]|uniref:F-box/LRR-repeat protein 7-like n=1 Tax=Aricia agestis TaxID=91739 RepID=UPI001C20B58E|nr:F-box/LRR-repeat protein 7-like [Aricia agestis]